MCTDCEVSLMRVITGVARGKRLITVTGNDIVRPTGEKVKEALGENADVRRQTIGPVIGSHCGPGTLGVCFIGKDKE